MKVKEQLKKKQLLLTYAERIGMEVKRDYGDWVAV